MTLVIIACSLLAAADNVSAARLYEGSRKTILDAKSLKIVVDSRHVFTSVVQSDPKNPAKRKQKPKVTKTQSCMAMIPDSTLRYVVRFRFRFSSGFCLRGW